VKQLEAVRRKLHLVQSVVDMVLAMLAYWDASQRCVFANRAYEKWFGIANPRTDTSPHTAVRHTLKRLARPPW
jgi:hypothetical protein